MKLLSDSTASFEKQEMIDSSGSHWCFPENQVLTKAWGFSSTEKVVEICKIFRQILGSGNPTKLFSKDSETE